MRRIVTALLPLAVLFALMAVLPACSDDDDTASGGGDADGDTGGGDDEEPTLPFCDAYLNYLADSTERNLRAVEKSADDPQVSEYVQTIESDPSVDALLAATLDLDDLARRQCQPEWTAGAQGAGNTPAAAQAFLDALVAGDRVGARNVASANAIAVFEPWEPIEVDPEAGTPALADIGGQSFSLVLGPSSVAQCEVETGVVVACQRAG